MIDDFLNSLGIPKACLLDKPVFKKMFLDNADLDAGDKKALSEDVEKIRWQYTLNPSTINVAPFQDAEREYLEIAFLSAELSSDARLNRIAALMQRAIPYPLILVFGHKKKVSVCLAEKRINQADKTKLVLVDRLQSQWIDVQNPSATERGFLDAIQLQRLPVTNFYALYEAFQAQLVQLIVSGRTGTFVPASIASSKVHAGILTQIDALEREIVALRSMLKREHQMSGKITVNSQIKTRKDAILGLEAQLKLVT